MLTLKNDATLDIKDLPGSLINNIKSKLTIANPKLKKNMQLGLSLHGIAATLKCYTEENGFLHIPIGFTGEVLKLLPHSFFNDQRTNGNPIKLEFRGKLRSYQIDALDTLKEQSVGVISSPTGSGKSVMMCSLIVDKAVQTLVLVNTLELANQFKQNLLKYTSIKEDNIYLFGGGSQFDLGLVTIALFQSMDKLPDSGYELINKKVGMVLTDEVHITGATTYFRTLSKIAAKRKYGFSATPEREDGLTPLIHFASGPIRKQITFEDVGNNIMKPVLEVIETDYHFPLFDMTEFTSMISDLSINEERNNLIVKSLIPYKDKQKVLLCSRVMQCLLLQKQIPNSKILVGAISKEDRAQLSKYFSEAEIQKILKQRGKKYRKEVVKELNSGELKTVISTYRLFALGLDFAGLEVAAFCAPIKAQIQVKQCRGRIMRVNADKQPICIDFQDSRVGLLKSHSKIRQRLLKRF